MFTHPFPLNCYPAIQEYVVNYMAQFCKNAIYAEKVNLPTDLQYQLEQELSGYGLPGPSNFLAFKRRNYFKPVLDTVHVDYSTSIIHSSIVLPIENCKDTAMFWMDGEYDLVTVTLPHGDPYQIVNWKGTPNMVNKEEIIEPTLCRVDIPHDALSNRDGSYRTILSIRLIGNPAFEEVIARRFTSTSL